MCRIEKDQAYGSTVYNILTEKKIPYQLSFERDLFYDRVNVVLVPMINPEKNNCPDLKGAVLKSFSDFFDRNSDQTVYLDIDIYHERNQITLYKFLKWMEPYLDEFDISIEMTKTQSILYAEIFIKKAVTTE